MKKIINDVEKVEEQLISGLIKANPDKLKGVDGELIVMRKQKKNEKVTCVTGGGSGHEPAHAGYVGYGMLDAAVPGRIYTSPSVDAIKRAIREVDCQKGTLMIIKNYTGDIVNFTMAAEELEEEDNIKTMKVIVNDDVAVDNSTWTQGRRGVAGTVFVHKIAGAKAESGAELAEVAATAQKAIDNIRTMSMAIHPCIVPAAGIPGFCLNEDEMEIGIGIHGEPGVRKEKIKSANEIADELLEKILADLDYEGRDVAVLINGCGGTPLMELYIVFDHVADVLKEKNINIYRSYVGNYMTSIEMQGFSITLLRLDDELKQMLDAPADTPALKE